MVRLAGGGGGDRYEYDTNRLSWRTTKTWIELLLAPIIVITALYTASIGPISTLVTLLAVLPTIIYSARRYYLTINRLTQTKFFLSWSISTLVILISVFELEVVPYLEILIVENFVLILLTSSAVILVLFIRKNQTVDNNSSNSLIQSHIITNCDQINCNYNYWIQSYISNRFNSIYLISQLLTLMALIYGSQLTLTTICHSSLMYQTILIPEDCSDVYFDSDIKLCFVSSIYSLLIAACIILCLSKSLIKLWFFKKQTHVKYVQLNKFIEQLLSSR
ncbi:uncharacterized protein LOC128966123 [Oppia nitens]|uniref:uncharacterized protein LOC128966123 n=1 Tax=Oppia nitens TaxID=1686743 RepID=UPI0023D9EA6C|nr:uncharacterized protein LOC128966123 [Oppia nitens]